MAQRALLATASVGHGEAPGSGWRGRLAQKQRPSQTQVVLNDSVLTVTAASDAPHLPDSGSSRIGRIALVGKSGSHSIGCISLVKKLHRAAAGNSVRLEA